VQRSHCANRRFKRRVFGVICLAHDGGTEPKRDFIGRELKPEMSGLLGAVTGFSKPQPTQSLGLKGMVGYQET
jgi:hypothetical protein